MSCSSEYMYMYIGFSTCRFRKYGWHVPLVWTTMTSLTAASPVWKLLFDANRMTYIVLAAKSRDTTSSSVSCDPTGYCWLTDDVKLALSSLAYSQVTVCSKPPSSPGRKEMTISRCDTDITCNSVTFSGLPNETQCNYILTKKNAVFAGEMCKLDNYTYLLYVPYLAQKVVYQYSILTVKIYL